MADLEDFKLEDDIQKDNEINAGTIGRRVTPAKTEALRDSTSQTYSYTQQIAMPSSLGMKSPQKFTISSKSGEDTMAILLSKILKTGEAEATDTYFGGFFEDEGNFYFAAYDVMLGDDDFKWSENTELRDRLFEETVPADR